MLEKNPLFPLEKYTYRQIFLKLKSEYENP
jgi:hypothetical protein